MSEHELAFMKRLLLALGRHPSLRVWRQNVGHVPIHGFVYDVDSGRLYEVA